MLRVEVTRDLPRPPEDIWACVRDFCAPWHPWIATMAAGEGGRLRSFTVQGESKLYQERLTWFSDSERCFRYTHVAGIERVTRYDALMRVDPDGDGRCKVTMAAEVMADEPRMTEIVQGTRLVFEAGLEALAELRTPDRAVMTPVRPSPMQEVILDGTPRLALSVAGQGPLVLFLHGIGGNRTNWDAQLTALGPGYTAVAMDLRGYGGSTLGPAPSTVEAYCEDIERVRAYFGADQMVLVGLSYGAWIATSYATRNPVHMAGLVVAGGCTGMSEAPQDVREGFRTSRLAPLDAGLTPADFAPDVVAAICGQNASYEAKTALRESMSSIPSATYRDAVRCFTTSSDPHDFARLTCPILLMTGAHDTLASPAEICAVAERIHGNAPFVQFEVLAGAGHVCNLEAQDTFTRRLRAFLGASV